MAKKVSGGKGSGSLGRPGKARNIRLGARLVIVFGLVLSFTNTAYAGKWNKQDYSESKIELRLDWSWTAPEQGRYLERWNDNYSLHFYAAEWVSGVYRVGISLGRLAPGQYWKRIYEIEKDTIIWWGHFKNVGVSDIRTISCAAPKCVTFKSAGRNCVAFKYISGSLGSRQEGDQGSDSVVVYYCPELPENGADKIDEIMNAIVLKK